MDEKKVLTKFSEFVYGDSIKIKSTSNPTVKIFCGENGSMTVSENDIIVYVDSKSEEIFTTEQQFNWDWNDSRESTPQEIQLNGFMLIGKVI